MKKPCKRFTLCVVHEPPRVLLGMKKRGFGAGRWNGFGGKVHEGETIPQAAAREIKEEAGVVVRLLVPLGILDFEFAGGAEVLEMHIFKGHGLDGEPQESDEMRPQWFDVAEIPFNEMWPDDAHWMPLFLPDKRFRGRFLFDTADGATKILEMDLREVPAL